MKESNFIDPFNNHKNVREWYLGIHRIFKHIQETKNWNKYEAWNKLKIELINTVGPKNYVRDDLDWVKSILLDDIKPTTEECLRVAKRYPNTTPLLDSLKNLI